METIIFIALSASFLISFLDKIYLTQYISERTKLDLLHKMLNCDFCISFWSSLVIGLVIAGIYKDPVIIAYAIPSTPITKYFINGN